MKYFVLFFFVPSLCFALATSDTYQVENEMPIAGGGRQTSDSFTNIGAIGQNIVPARASSDSYLADFGMAFWNAGSAGTLTVTNSSDNASSAEFTLSYASADPDSPLFMACYGTTQADVDNSCAGTATRAFTSAFLYEITGLLNNTTYYFKIYPLSGYDASANPVITTRSSNTVSSSRAQGTVFLPVSGGSGGGGGGGGMPVERATLSTAAPPSAFARVTGFLASLFGIEPSVPALSPSSAASAIVPLPTAAPFAANAVSGKHQQDSFVAQPANRFLAPFQSMPPSMDTVAVVASPAPLPVSIAGTVFVRAGRSSVPLPNARITLYACPSPSARPFGCSVWHSSGKNANPVFSDSRGAFSFASPPGIYRFRAEAMGYETAEGNPFPLTGVRFMRIDMKPTSIWNKISGLFSGF